eukprot:CAMPEP_0184696906 /NCGR_PEP_ID=MMETSP0313-20130426/4063_1 /TAXON_ID=2792 /ORGANISM="Porphyridium aerugineum, Strain SAG 1380-2" /LENGTH=177 /DNA_ID=CAMNT_0027155633 /DNA_START=185 /DNA_END=715 /DNA_ORIENTATION=+
MSWLPPPAGSLTGQRIPRVVVLNAKEIAEAKARLPPEFQPRYVNGRFRRPLYSRRQIAMMRKKFILAGKEWPYEVPHKILHYNFLFRGTKAQRQREDKVAMIETKMRQMPQLIEEYRKEQRARVKKRSKHGYDPLTRKPTGLRELTKSEQEEKQQDFIKLREYFRNLDVSSKDSGVP